MTEQQQQQPQQPEPPPLDLEAIRKREQAATPGPWVYDGMHYEIQTPQSEDQYWLIVSECRSAPDQKYQCDKFGHQFDANYEFIAYARADISALLARVESDAKDIKDYEATLHDAMLRMQQLKAEVKRLKELGGVDDADTET